MTGEERREEEEGEKRGEVTGEERREEEEGEKRGEVTREESREASQAMMLFSLQD